MRPRKRAPSGFLAQLLGEEGVVVGVRRHAAAEDADAVLAGGELVPGMRRNEHGVPWDDLSPLTVSTRE